MASRRVEQAQLEKEEAAEREKRGLEKNEKERLRKKNLKEQRDKERQAAMEALMAMKRQRQERLGCRWTAMWRRH